MGDTGADRPPIAGEGTQSAPASHIEEQAAAGSVDDRMIAGMRLVLAVSALLVTYIDPSEPSRFVAHTYVALVLYATYCAALYVLTVWRGPAGAYGRRWAHWVDIACCTALIGLSDGADSIYFLFYFFAIIVASFLRGFASGMRVTLVSAGLFVGMGYVAYAAELSFELNRFLMRSISLLVVGGMMAYWGGRDRSHKRRLALLGAVTRLSSLHLGVDHTINTILERARAFYGAERCLQITVEPDTGEHRLRVATDSGLRATIRVDTVPPELARVFLTLPAGYAVLYAAPKGGSRLRRARYYAYDTTAHSRAGDGLEACEALADSLEAESFVSVPVRYQGRMFGRFFLTGPTGTFAESDVEFLGQLVDHVAPIIENIRLVDRLASEAAEQERQRIARDIHDSVIQPYIGLGLGLAALRQKVVRGDSLAAADVDRLARLTEDAITGLRRSTHELKNAHELDGGLVPAVTRFAARFADATGVDVRVEADGVVDVDARVAAEAFQIVGEGLSNVRRHTRGLSATIAIARDDGYLSLSIANGNAGGLAPAPFLPRSISVRVSARGGETRVEPDADGSTRVTVRIPL